MIVYLNIKNRNCLPEIDELVEIMWGKGVSVSRAGDSYSFKKCTSLAICWDKWVDDPRWESHPKFKEYIYFDISKDINPRITIEIDDEATKVDMRSVHKIALHIANKCDGMISLDNIKWKGIALYKM